MLKKIAQPLLLTAALTSINIYNGSINPSNDVGRSRNQIIIQEQPQMSCLDIMRAKFLKAKHLTAGTALTFGASFATGFIASKAHFSTVMYFSSSYMSSIPSIIFNATALAALATAGYVFYKGYILLSRNVCDPKDIDFKKIFTCLLIAGGIITGMALGSFR